MNEHSWQPDVRRSAALLVGDAIVRSGRSLLDIAGFAGVSVSTLQRARDPDTSADVGVGTLWRIAAACGVSFDLSPRPLYDPAAAEAAKPHPDNDSRTQWWSQRFRLLPDEAAIIAAAVRAQFYSDGNKRTARLMMTGHLMRSGFESVSIPWARRLEFNVALDRLFTTDDATDLIAFLATCALG